MLTVEGCAPALIFCVFDIDCVISIVCMTTRVVLFVVCAISASIWQRFSGDCPALLIPVFVPACVPAVCIVATRAHRQPPRWAAMCGVVPHFLLCAEQTRHVFIYPRVAPPHLLHALRRQAYLARAAIMAATVAARRFTDGLQWCVLAWCSVANTWHSPSPHTARGPYVSSDLDHHGRHCWRTDSSTCWD